MKTSLLATLLLAILSLGKPGRAQEQAPTDAPLPWWKGNLHTHTLWSDGDDFPEMIAEWYLERGYHFLALSDHNVLSQGQKWIKLSDLDKRGGKIALDKYLARFGESWVEMRGDGAEREVRLKPLGEVRSLVEQRGRFLMIQAEEISDAFEGRPIHINAANLVEQIAPQRGTSVSNTIENNLRGIYDQARQTGQPILPHLNHPNFRWAVTAEDIAEAVSDQFFEIYNGHPLVNQLGDAEHTPVERTWDIANALRISKFGGAPLYGLATDDSHHYHFPGMARSAPGRGWIMVRARHLTPESLIRAVVAGDFYASSGVVLREVKYDAGSSELRVEIEPDGEATYTTRFVGTLRGADTTPHPAPTTQRVTQLYSDEIGRELAVVEGLNPAYRLTGQELYVRAIITSSEAHGNPSFAGQVKQAWTQPVGWASSPRP